MAQPTTYDRQSSFTLLAQVNPSTPYEGTDLDAEFNAVKVTLDDVLASLVHIQRDDGALANQSVGPDQLASSIDIGINPPSAWMTATAYTQYDTAFNGTSLYRATLDHTSGTVFATDLAAGKWELLADFNVVSIADGSVTTVKIADAAVTGAKIANANVTVAKIADLAVQTAKIDDLAVTTAKLAANSVSTVKIQDAAVETAKIADANVTLAKMANVAAGTIFARLSGGTGVPVVDTVANVLAAFAAVVGDSGSGGTKGLVPAPAAGDAAVGKLLGADGTWKALATQADQETATSVLAPVTPGRQQFHPSAAKCWCFVTVSGGTPTMQTNYNITSITDTAQGRLTITIATDFSSANWAASAMFSYAAGTLMNQTTAVAAGSIELRAIDAGANMTDPVSWSFIGFGDQ